MMKSLDKIVFGMTLAWCGGIAQAHEFWIEPLEYFVAPGEQIAADIKVGEAFEGSVYRYIPQNFRRFDVAFDGELAPVEGRMGDRPAAALDAPGAGLVTLIHVTTDQRLLYTEWEKFVKFVTHKDALWTLDEHRARGWPDERFVEGYSRHAKSLIAVGSGRGADRAWGLETEIVALENPYTGEMEDGIDVQVLYRGAVKPDAQVEVFDKDPDGAVEISIVQADGEGRATVPVTPGHSYLIDSVVLRPAGPELQDSMEAVWESLWASLTFQVPK